MGKARPRISDDLDNLLYSDWEEIIQQAHLCEEDRYIAKRYLLDGIPQMDVAVEIGDVFNRPFERSTISHRLPNILLRIERTAVKLGKFT